MSVHVEIPTEVFGRGGSSMSRDVLEAVAIDGYRTDQLSIAEIMHLLEFENRDEAYNFLSRNNVPWIDYTAEDVQREADLLKELVP